MIKSILYVSYTGMMEPLGQSQVVSYIKSMSGEYKFIVLSLEKPVDLSNRNLFEETNEAFKKFNIEWIPKRYKLGMKGYISNFYCVTLAPYYIFT